LQRHFVLALHVLLLTSCTIGGDNGPPVEPSSRRPVEVPDASSAVGFSINVDPKVICPQYVGLITGGVRPVEIQFAATVFMNASAVSAVTDFLSWVHRDRIGVTRSAGTADWEPGNNGRVFVPISEYITIGRAGYAGGRSAAADSFVVSTFTSLDLDRRYATAVLTYDQAVSARIVGPAYNDPYEWVRLSVEFSPGANDGVPVRYDWYKDGALFVTSTEPHIDIASPPPAQEQRYEVVVVTSIGTQHDAALGVRSRANSCAGIPNCNDY
jgi:hypothetical protein